MAKHYAESHGQTAVIGAKAVLRKYDNEPWADVLAAAERGDDGLRVVAIGTETYDIQHGEFALREISTVTRGKVAGLYEQRW